MPLTSAPEVFRQLADKLSCVSEEGFFQHLARSLADILGVDHAVVEHVDSHQSIVTTLAAWSQDVFIETAPYALRGTPCQQIADHSRLFVASHVQQQFPDDQRLAALGAEGYLGVSIAAPGGGFLGVIALMHSSVLGLPSYADEVLRIAAALAGVELARQLAESQTRERLLYKQRALQRIGQRNEALINTINEQQRFQHAVVSVATAVSAENGEAFLHQLTAHTAEALSAEVGFIALLNERDADFAHTLTLYVNGQRQSNFAYYLPGVPCHKVMVEQECIVHDGAAIMLPTETNGALSWVNGYVGRRLDNSHGQPMGLIGVMFKQPLADVAVVRNVLQIFAARAASELERQQDEVRIRQLAFCDPGTQLPNRAAFMRHLEQVVTDTQTAELALLLLDLNHFKEINDTAGHDLGDLVLKAVAERFVATLTEGQYLARLGGDEFVVVCPGVEANGALATAQRLWDSIALPFIVEQHSFELSVGIGLAFYPQHAATPLELLKHADIAMYQAKRQKLPLCVFEPWMERVVAEQLHIAKRLAFAIAEKQLSLHFQPQVDLHSGRLIGAEALCRWHDEELGDVSPGKFIPIAEERGMIVALGSWVIEEACRQLAAWREQGHTMHGQLAINIAAQQFEEEDLVASVLNRCAQFGIEASQLSLEITESGIMENPEKAIAITEVLKSKGLGLSIDDFGTGYSSLAYLKRFAADKIKIDISFVRDMLTSDNDRAIVATIIAMANTLGLETIAEGIENQDQITALLALGCAQGQGYCFDRPLTADQFSQRWLR
ncbi:MULTISPECIES: bifunctional diguanylate cyclase/phosphodiesterase [unclassified Halomonas]|uniref:putative bifunctional diguanylate cyclase/phosphodiesterase n=1 Tax=unclassified Halomonas TaxID=2609666 RepID=UPI0007D99DE9|nr:MULTISPECIES: bifunctional diguanylate cyclase/phosphodiesterase [unclassified Halomonas]MBT2786828.1 EAL domain-containing protein [Halomonas sp. ISL-106]MBT2798519.1 EAL domain-containing protein [Halomonas sp. ISL-104]OAL58109.1 histidine kinase [Halomonas sp. ALS9]